MRRRVLRPAGCGGLAAVPSRGPTRTLAAGVFAMAAVRCLSSSSLGTPTRLSAPAATSFFGLTQRRFQSGAGGSGGFSTSNLLANGDDGDDDAGSLESELASVLEREGNLSVEAVLARPLERVDISASSPVQLEKLDRPPARFDLLTNSLAYRWQTTARQARKVCGPMREWATELKYRTGCHVETEPTFPNRLLLTESEGGYACADDVDITVYLFGSERGIFNCHRLMETIVELEPAYVRLGVFRRVPDSDKVEWLLLRRINREMRPPDVPPISLKLPGKWTLLYEQYKEAAIRSLWEETGIAVEAARVFPTARLEQQNPSFYWRVPVHYFVAEVPYDVEVLGPQVVLNAYMHHWDARLLRQSPDPVDRAWAQLANPETGCAWMEKGMIDELQLPLRGENYMAIRYTPPPYSRLAEVLGFELPPEAVAASTAEESPAEGEQVAERDGSAVDEQADGVTTEAVKDEADKTKVAEEPQKE